MSRKRVLGNRSPLFSSLVCAGLSVLLLGAACDKAPETQKEPEAVPSASAAPQEEPPKPDVSTEPTPDEEVPQDEARSAVEPDVEPPQFDKSSSQEFRSAFAGLQKWVGDKRGKVYAALVDLESDKWLLRANAKTSVNPASNAKVLTAAAALELLGPAYKFKTELFGKVGADGRCSRLVLRGGGAPDLTTADLWRLLRVAKGQGLAEVAEIVVDQSRFTEQYVPPAFEQQPGEWAPFRAPISALSLNQNSVSLNVVSTAAGEAARVWYDPPGIVVPKGRVETGASGSGDRVTWNLKPKADAAHPDSVVGGKLAEGLGRRRYARRLEDPRLAGGYALSALLQESGIKVTGGVSLGTRKKEPRIALWYSEPLAEAVRALGKDSNNFVAEMLLVSLSQAGVDKAKKDEPWSSERGAAKVVEWLKAKKIDTEGLVVKNGSGLFDANKMSAELLTSVLAQVESNPRIYQDFVSHLAMGSTDGTMKKRMRGSEIGARIRAKTGTLRNVDALTGYIQRANGESPAAFSIIIVGPRASHGEVRAKVDRTVLAWAKAL